MAETSTPDEPTDDTDRRIYRCWIEIRSVESGEVRTLPLTAYRRIPLVAKTRELPPARTVLSVTDGAITDEAASLDELTATLRTRYPDGAYERRLFYERDLDAERTRNAALNGLIELLAELAAQEALASRAPDAIEQGGRDDAPAASVDGRDVDSPTTRRLRTPMRAR